MFRTELCGECSSQGCALGTLAHELEAWARQRNLVFELLDLTNEEVPRARREQYEQALIRVARDRRTVIVFRVRTDDDERDKFNSGNCYTFVLTSPYVAQLLRVKFGRAKRYPLSFVMTPDDRSQTINPNSHFTPTTLCAMLHKDVKIGSNALVISTIGQMNAIVVTRLDRVTIPGVRA